MKTFNLPMFYTLIPLPQLKDRHTNKLRVQNGNRDTNVLNKTINIFCLKSTVPHITQQMIHRISYHQSVGCLIDNLFYFSFKGGWIFQKTFGIWVSTDDTIKLDDLFNVVIWHGMLKEPPYPTEGNSRVLQLQFLVHVKT